MQPQRHLLLIPLGIQRKQPCEHVIPHGIGPAVAPGEFAAAGDGAVGLQLALEIEGIAGLSEDKLTAVDALLQLAALDLADAFFNGGFGFGHGQRDS